MDDGDVKHERGHVESDPIRADWPAIEFPDVDCLADDLEYYHDTTDRSNADALRL